MCAFLLSLSHTPPPTRLGEKTWCRDSRKPAFDCGHDDCLIQGNQELPDQDKCSFPFLAATTRSYSALTERSDAIQTREQEQTEGELSASRAIYSTDREVTWAWR